MTNSIAEDVNYYPKYVSYYIIDYKNRVASSNLAKSAGTTYLKATVTNDFGKSYSERCRIDVVNKEAAEEVLASAELATTSATVELYSTAYKRIEVIPVREQNLAAGLALDGEIAEETGLAIQEAHFTDPTLNTYFKLKPVDDHVLEIIPTDEAVQFGLANAGNLKKTFTSTISVKVGDSEAVTAAKFKMTVKKSLPSVKATAVKLNTYTGADKTGGVSFLQGKSDIILSNLKANTAYTTAIPDWLEFDEENAKLTYIGVDKGKKSGNVYLIGKIEGWHDAVSDVQVAVKVSASATAPKISFKPATMVAASKSNDAASTSLTISPSNFSAENVSIEKLTEGSGKKMLSWSYGTEEFNNRLTAELNNNILTVSSNNIDGNNHTYMLHLRISDKLYAVKVMTALPTMKVKTSGSIDLAVTGSPVKIIPTFTGMTDVGSVLSYDCVIKDANGNDVSELFSFNASLMEITANNSNRPAKGTYYVEMSADVGDDNIVKAKPVKIIVKASSKAPTISVALKASGTIDVLRDGTKTVITPSIKNRYGIRFTKDSICFYSYANRTYTKTDNPGFNVEQSIDGSIYTLTSNGSLKAGKYYIGFSDELISMLGAKPVYTAITVKQGKAAYKLSPSSITMLKKDKFSSEIVSIYTTDKTLNSINRVEIASGSEIFNIEEFDNGRWVLGYAEIDGKPLIAEVITTGKTKKATIKLNVYCDGCSDKPAATISLKVAIK